MPVNSNETYDNLYPSRWLKADDIGGEDLPVTIQDVNAEAVGDDREMKFVISFHEVDKDIVLNKTNAKTLIKLFGKDPNAWVGKSIALYATEVTFRGDTVLGVRIRLTQPTPATVQVPAPPPAFNPADEAAF